MEFNFDVMILIAIMVMAVVFFTLEVLPLEVTAMGVTGLLLLFDILTPEEAISGFSNKAVITIGAIFIISKALVKTGFLEVLADYLYRLAGARKWLTIFIFLLTVSIISGFINNTASVAIFIPLAINLSTKFHISPTKLLLPLSYAAIFGGTLTLIGTSTNLVVSAIIEKSGLPPFSMFEFTKLGIIFLGIGTLYNILLARFFLPSRTITSSLTQKYHLGTYLTEFKVSADSPVIGKTYVEMELSEKYNLQVYKIIRKDEHFRFNLRSVIIQEDDIFLVQINVNDIMRLKNDLNLLLLSDVKMSQQELAGKNHVLVEGLVTMQSNMIGKTLSEFDFRNRYSAFVLAIKRQRELLREKIAHISLKFSDTLLIMVPKEKLESLRKSTNFIVLEELDICLKYERYWWLSILVIPVVMALASLGIVPIIKGAVLGAILLLMLRSLSIQDAYDSINWSVIFLIAALIPIGTAIHNTGADKIIGDMIVSLGYFINTTNLNMIINLVYMEIFIHTQNKLSLKVQDRPKYIFIHH